MKLETQLYVGKGNPLERVQSPLFNHIGCKAEGGLFTSTYLGESIGSDWLQWCLANEFNLPDNDLWNGWLIEVNKDANLYVVDTVEDMNYLFDTYGYFPFEGTKLEYIDFLLMAKDFDGLHLTEHGQAVTRHPNFLAQTGNDILNGMRSFYGWDVESTHFFRNVFDDIKKITLTIKEYENDY
jgi:hypothetical protein